MRGSVTEGLIAAARDEAVKHGAMFLAVTEDTGIQVWPDPAVRAKFAKQLHVPDLFYPDRRIAALGQRDGFAVLTLAEPLQRYAQEHQRFSARLQKHADGLRPLERYRPCSSGRANRAKALRDDSG